jgi:hypothetical protein
MSGNAANGNAQNDTTNVQTLLNDTKQQDPFYLNSGNQGKSSEMKTQNRFGAIQLLDSDGNDSNEKKKRRKKRSKSKKQAKKLGTTDFEFLAGMGASNNASQQHSNMQSIIDSDDDDEDDEPAVALGRKPGRNDTSASKMNNLAGIDLTTPLRREEFIPERKHHVVQDRHGSELNVPSEAPRAGKKKKKEKKSKSSKEKRPKVLAQNTSATSDLLDFGVFNVTEDPGVSLSEDRHVNPINSAFNDLLSLDAPNSGPAQALPTHTSLKHSHADFNDRNGSLGKPIRLWQKAAIKETGTMPFDWNNLSVTYRVHSPKNNGVKMSLRVQNKSTTDHVHNVSFEFPGLGPLVLPDIAPMTKIDAGKIGPFSISPIDLKGKVQVGSQSSSVKFTLPSSLNLSPLPLEQDEIISMLSNGQWASYSSKLDLNEEIDDSRLRMGLVDFLSAGLIGDPDQDVTNYMLACKSTNGSTVVMLVKKSKNCMKIDVKATDKKLAKTISSDLKKVII